LTDKLKGFLDEPTDSADEKKSKASTRANLEKVLFVFYLKSRNKLKLYKKLNDKSRPWLHDYIKMLESNQFQYFIGTSPIINGYNKTLHAAAAAVISETNPYRFEEVVEFVEKYEQANYATAQQNSETTNQRALDDASDENAYEQLAMPRPKFDEFRRTRRGYGGRKPRTRRRKNYP